MIQPAASKMVLNNGAISSQLLNPQQPADQVMYEVFRIEQGCPLFLADHLARLYQGIQQIGHQFSIPLAEFQNRLTSLVRESRCATGNIKTEVLFSNDQTAELTSRAFFIPTAYPDPEQYAHGVVCGFLNAQRAQPSIKIANPMLRTLSDTMMDQAKIHETLLVNPEGSITEGSRSNLFFIKSGMVYTAPDHLVLGGIMRQKVLQIMEACNIACKLEAVKKNELNRYEACFMTGTSPRVLPIRKVDTTSFQVPDPLIQKIARLLDQLIQQHIITTRNNSIKTG